MNQMTQEIEQLNSPEKLVRNSKKIVKRNKKGQLEKGSILNPNGRPLGSKDFGTDFDEVVEEIAKEENITISEARKILLKVAYKEAKSGKFPFYKDTMDRYYGEPQKKIDITTGGDKIQPNEKTQELIDKFEEELKKLKTNA